MYFGRWKFTPQNSMLNTGLKQTVTTKAPARTKGQLLAARHMRKPQKLPQRVKRYFEHAPVKHAA